MLAVGLWGVVRGNVWRDEGVTLQVARRSLPEIWRLLRTVDAVHGLYYLLMHTVLPADAGELALRLPSVLAAAATAGLVAAVGARLARPRVGLWAGLLYAVTPLAGQYAQQGRSYALVAAGAALATLLLVRAAERPERPRPWCAYAAVSAATVLLHELAGLLLAAHAVALLLGRAAPRVRRAWAGAAAPAALALVPLALVSHRQAAQVGWLRPPDGSAAVRLLREFTGPTLAVLAAELALAALALCGPWARRRAGLPLQAVALPLLVVPPAALLAVSQQWPLYHARYVLFALAGGPLLVAAGADRAVRAVRAFSGGRGRGVVAAAGALAVGCVFWWQFPLHRSDRAAGRGEDHAALAAVAARELRPGDPVLYLPLIARRVPLTYPDAFHGVRDVALRTSGAASGTLYGREAGPAELRRRLAGVDRLWVLSEAGPLRGAAGDRGGTEGVKLAVLRGEFARRAEYVTVGGALRLYVRR
ncbi:glycosyltransferase family 39 protein [Streptomyces sp. MNP-20]|uniref:glycosyltransferase family 39 protein n=1 Tax=Streptomyces sp. MNP-20 TaxID=2721165 RepID=UPI00155587C0|nr:glycosyltransferase family 39 protein [Streptomyces sp. MNP-20]